jgi:RES domain-containing protein
MEIFRITKKSFANLEGVGGLYYPGRWHEKGYRVLYASQHRSLAALEYLVHLSSINLIGNDFVITTIFIPDDIPALTLPKHLLGSKWENVNYLSTTQKCGTKFLTENKYLILKVPSAIIKQEHNYIINPANNNINLCKVTAIEPFMFDKRLSERT